MRKDAKLNESRTYWHIFLLCLRFRRPKLYRIVIAGADQQRGVCGMELQEIDRQLMALQLSKRFAVVSVPDIDDPILRPARNEHIVLPAEAALEHKFFLGVSRISDQNLVRANIP